MPKPVLVIEPLSAPVLSLFVPAKERVVQGRRDHGRGEQQSSDLCNLS